METQFMGETMATTHMIERDPATYHEIWHEAWRDAWETNTKVLYDMLWRTVDFIEGINPGLKIATEAREFLKTIHT